MNFRKLASALAIAGAASVAQAAPTITNLDGALSPFGGFDWHSGAAAWTSGFSGIPGSTFTLYYAAVAIGLNDTGSGTLDTPGIDTNADGNRPSNSRYEYTIFASLTEEVVACTLTVCSFKITGGNYDIYYDNNALGGFAAKQADGTGYLDGVKIISGSVGTSTNLFSTTTGGQASLNGNVTYTNGTYVNPALAGTSFTSTLQLGSAVNNFNIPTGFDFNNDHVSDALGTPGVIIFQADGNQTFGVPEPTMLLLAGSALAACGLVSRRRRNVA